LYAFSSLACASEVLSGEDPIPAYAGTGSENSVAVLGPDVDALFRLGTQLAVDMINNKKSLEMIP